MKKEKYKLLKLMFGAIVLIFIVPSLVFFFRNENSVYVYRMLEYKYLLDINIDSKIHVTTYSVIIAIMMIFYYLIIKHRRKLFKNVKAVYKYIAIISIICVFSMPFMSSDIYYYLGIGRLAAKYGQNPYYTDMKSYVENNNVSFENDSVLEAGYSNYWAKTTVVYGALWSIICTVVAFFSFGNLNAGILIFKILNLLVHIFNCILLYKISNKKIFPLLYGLNPFILIEGIVNVHNDIFMVFFILLAIYEVYKKKHFVLGLVFLACATDIKYVTILLLPLMIIYYYRNESLKGRIAKCIKYGLLFAIFCIIPYALYIRDMEVFNGIATQQERYAKGLYCYLYVQFPKYANIIKYIRGILIYGFILAYSTMCAKLITSKNIKFYQEMRKIYVVFLSFLLFMVTNFQPWYFIWLSAFLVWQKSVNIKLITQIQFVTLIADSVFVFHSEAYVYGRDFFVVFVVGTWICMIANIITRQRQLHRIEAKN